MAPSRFFKGLDLSALDMNNRNAFRHAHLGEDDALQKLLIEDPTLAKCVWGYFTPLDFAVRSGHHEAVKLLLEHGAEVAKNPIGWSDDPLTKAKDRGFEQIVQLLKQHLSQSFHVSEAGIRLADLIRRGLTEEVLQELDRFPEWIHAADERGNTPLHWAALTRNLPLIDELLRRGADLKTQRIDGATPLQLAMEGDYWFRSSRDLNPNALRNEWFLIGYFVARGADYDIWTAASIGDTGKVEFFLEQDPGLAQAINSIGKRPLSYAAKYGNTLTVKRLLECGADPNAAERDAPTGSALWLAAKGNHVECARLLLEHGANPNARVDAGGNCLSIAMSRGHQRVVDLLYTYGASLNLDTACYLGRIDLVSEILAANPSLVNDGGDYGPLCMAAGFGHLDIVKLLIRNGADLNAPWFANNYMGYAMDQGSEMARLLLESGADPNNANWLGVTYLHKAAWKGSLELAELLIEFGADLHAIDEEYQSTPLGWAAKYGQTEMVRYLLKREANPSLPLDEPWAQPLSWATRKGNAEMEELIAAAIAASS